MLVFIPPALLVLSLSECSPLFSCVMLFSLKNTIVFKLKIFLYGNIFLFIQAMLNLLWLGYSIMWYHNEKDMISSNTSTASPRDLVITGPGERREEFFQCHQPGIAQKQLSLHLVTGTSCMFGAHRQLHSCEEKYKQDLLHQAWGCLLWIQPKDNFFL